MHSVSNGCFPFAGRAEFLAGNKSRGESVNGNEVISVQGVQQSALAVMNHILAPVIEKPVVCVLNQSNFILFCHRVPLHFFIPLMV